METSDPGHDPSPKRRVRRQLLAARREHPADPGDGVAIRDAALAWEPLRNARTVALYASVGTEPDTRPLLEALHGAGLTVLLPVVLPDLDLDWAPYEPGRLELLDTRSEVRGIEEPVGARLGVDAVRTADLVIVPGLAVSATGERLGRGGGCYDRALARVAADVPVVVVLHPGEVGVDVPTEPHDRPVTHALTRDGLTPLG